MDKPAEADLGDLLSSKGIENKEEYVRFEQLSEKITWLAVIIGALVVQLPFGQDLNKEAIYILLILISASAFVWYRLLPKRLIGLNKTFIYTLITIIFLTFLVHITGC